MNVKPWARFWARLTDLNFFFSLLCIAALWIVLSSFDRLDQRYFADHLIENRWSLLFWMMSLIIWIVVESVLLSIWGTTPGKWFFGIEMTDQQGNKPEFFSALRRSFKVWLKGMGTGYPIISIFTWIYFYQQLMKNHITSWDNEGKFIISHEKLSIFKMILLGIVVVVMNLVLFYLWIAAAI